MLLILAAACLCQASPAEEAFRNIEDALRKATTANLTFKCEVAKKGPDKAELIRLSGSLLLKDEGKARLFLDFDPNDPALKLTDACDGLTLRHRVGLEPPVERPAPQAIRPSLQFAFTRLGIYYPAVVTGTLLFSHTPPRDGAEGYLHEAEVSRFKFEEEVPAGRILSYRVKARPRNPSRPAHDVDVRLLYSPRTFIPIKRVLTVSSEDTSYSIAETYFTFTLNEPIDDRQFLLDPPK